jgi:hypothetical protein
MGCQSTADVGEDGWGDGEPEHGDNAVAEVLVIQLHVQVEDSGGAQAVKAPFDRGLRQTGARLQFGERGPSIAGEDGEQRLVGLLQDVGRGGRFDGGGLRAACSSGLRALILLSQASGPP